MAEVFAGAILVAVEIMDKFVDERKMEDERIEKAY